MYAIFLHLIYNFEIPKMLLFTLLIHTIYGQQLQQIPECVQASDSPGTYTGGSQQDSSSVSTLTESETGGNCESLCLAADSLLEEARAREESGDLSVSTKMALFKSAHVLMIFVLKF